MTDYTTQRAKVIPAQQSHEEPNEEPTSDFLALFLQCAAWLTLVCGIIVAFSAWPEGFREREAGTGYFISIASAAAGVIQFAVLLALAKTLKYLKNIQEKI